MKKLALLGALAGMLLLPLAASAQTAWLLPNAQQQFVDGNGAPLAAASVYFYVPGTTTPKTTWQDPNQSVPKWYPVVLNSAGRAIIYGGGQYREVVYDSLGNLVWDQLTSSYLGLPIGCSSMPALSGDVSSTAGSCVTALAVVNSAPGTYQNATVTVNSKGQVTGASQGSIGQGFVNVLRNSSLSSWFHGTSVVISTSGGWCAEGVYVIPSGASVTCAQVFTSLPTGSLTASAINITWTTGLSGLTVRYVQESNSAAQLAGKVSTFQFLWANASGGSVAPSIQAKFPTIRDNWGASVIDLVVAPMQACGQGASCTEAYAWPVSDNAGNGYEENINFGNVFTDNSGLMIGGGFDLRATPQATAGMITSPPVPEVRDAATDTTWNQRYYETSYENGVPGGSATDLGLYNAAMNITGGANNQLCAVVYKTQKRSDPTVAYFDGAGNSGMTSTYNAGFTNNIATVTAVNAGENNSTFTVSSVAGGFNVLVHYVADSTIVGG